MPIPMTRAPRDRLEYPAATLLPASPALSTRSLPIASLADIKHARNVALNMNATLPRLAEPAHAGLCPLVAPAKQALRRSISVASEQPAHLDERELSSRDALADVLSVHPSHRLISERRKISLPASMPPARSHSRPVSALDPAIGSPEQPSHAPAVLEKKPTASVSTIDWSPPISAAQQAQAAGGAFCRDGISSLVGGLAKYGVTQLLANNPASIALTATGAVAGGISGAYVGAGVGRALVAQRHAENPWALRAASGMGALCGAFIGAFGSLYTHFTAPVNHVAVEQIASLSGAVGRDVNQQWFLKEIGPRVERSPTWASAAASFFIYAAELSGINALAPFLPGEWNQQIKSMLTSILIEATDGATGSLLRGQLTDATFKHGTNRLCLPNSKASLAARSFELANASCLRNAGTTVTQGLKLSCTASGLAGVGNAHGAAAIAALTSAPTAFRGLLSTYVLPNNQKIIGYEQRLSADPGTIPVDVAGIVAGLDSVAIMSNRTPQRISTIS